MPRRIINVHTHIHKNQDIDQRVRLWRECGLVKVCIQVLSVDGSDQTYGNQGVLKWMEKYPDLMLGFARCDLGAEHALPEDVERFKDQGFHGLKFIAPFYGYDDERYFPLYEKASDLSMPILFHTGYLGHSSDHPQRETSLRGKLDHEGAVAVAENLRRNQDTAYFFYLCRAYNPFDLCLICGLSFNQTNLLRVTCSPGFSQPTSPNWIFRVAQQQQTAEPRNQLFE